MAETVDATGAARQRAEDPLLPLIARVREGDLSSFDEIYRRTRQDVYRTLYHLIGPTPDMDDLVQETFIQLLKSLKNFRGDSKFSTFLYRVCANVGLMHLRSGRRRKEDLVEELPDRTSGPSHDPERQAQVQQAARMLQQALATLAPEKRVVYVFHDFLGMGPDEISEALNIPANTARSRLSRAREDLVGAISRLRGDRAVDQGGESHGAP